MGTRVCPGTERDPLHRTNTWVHSGPRPVPGAERTPRTPARSHPEQPRSTRAGTNG